MRGSGQTADILGQQIDGSDAEQAVFDLLHKLEASEVDERRARSPVCCRCKVGGETIGYLAIDRNCGSTNFSPEEIEIINTFAGQAAIAIANAQLYMAQREEAWISTALLQVAEATGRANNLDEVLSTVARITPLLVGVEWCAVFLHENDKFPHCRN